MKHPLFETIKSPSNWPAGRCNHTSEQIAQRGTWTRLPDVAPSSLGGYHAVDVQPVGATTVTVLNPLDPGTVDDVPGEFGPGWLYRPGGTDIPCARVGRR